MGQPSKACCTISPIQTGDYDGKGEYIKLNGLKTYRTGPKDSKKGILLIYDIFGYYPQTIQGADILAYSDDDNKYQVFIPDFFEGPAAELAWFPPGDDKDKQSKLGEFFKTKADPQANTKKVGPLTEAIKKEHGVETLAVVGFCWGGKIAGLTSAEGTPFKAAAVAHPAFVDPEDAPKITIPFAMLPSKDEPKEDVEKWQKELKVPNKVEFFPTQIHGWMAARSDLKDENVKKEYERGYKLILEFFHEHL